MLFRDAIPTLVNKCVVDWVVKVIAALYCGFKCAHTKQKRVAQDLGTLLEFHFSNGSNNQSCSIPTYLTIAGLKLIHSTESVVIKNRKQIIAR